MVFEGRFFTSWVSKTSRAPKIGLNHHKPPSLTQGEKRPTAPPGHPASWAAHEVHPSAARKIRLESDLRALDGKQILNTCLGYQRDDRDDIGLLPWDNNAKIDDFEMNTCICLLHL